MKKGRHLGFGRALESSALLFAPRLTVSSLLLTPRPLGLTLPFLLLFPSRRPPFKLLTSGGHRTTFPTIPRAGRHQWGFPWAAVVINVESNLRFRGRDELLSTSSLRCPFSPPPARTSVGWRRLCGGTFVPANALATHFLLAPRLLSGFQGAWECHWWMTAALAAARAAATMTSGSSGLAAARLLSRAFLRESGRGSLLQASASSRPPGPGVLV